MAEVLAFWSVWLKYWHLGVSMFIFVTALQAYPASPVNKC